MHPTSPGPSGPPSDVDTGPRPSASAVGSRLRIILHPDKPWERAVQLSSIFSALIAVVTVMLSVATYLQQRRDSEAAGENSPVNLIPTAAAPPPGQRPGLLTATLDCESPGCNTPNSAPHIVATLTGTIDPGSEVHLISQAVTTRRWYLHGPITPDVDGQWSGKLDVSQHQAPRVATRIVLYAFILPSSQVDELADRQAAAGGAGLATSDLPDERRELTRIPVLTSSS